MSKHANPHHTGPVESVPNPGLGIMPDNIVQIACSPELHWKQRDHLNYDLPLGWDNLK